MRYARYVIACFALLTCQVAGSAAAQVSALVREPLAEQMIRAWIDAAGGPRIWDGVRDVTYTTTTIWYDSTEAEQRRRPRYVWIKKTGDGFRVRVERTEAEGKYIQGWDGKRAWATLNGSQVPDTARALTEVTYVAGDLTYWIGLPWKLNDPGVNLSYLDSDPNAAGHVVQVSFGQGVGQHDTDRYWYYFANPNSPFPTEIHYIEQGRAASTRSRMRVARMGTFNGASFMELRTLYNTGNRRYRSLLVSDIKVNAGIPDATFRR